MSSSETKNEQKEKDFGTTLYCAVAGAVWWFLANNPNSAALALAGFSLVCLSSAFCILAVVLPEPENEELHSSFAPIPQYQTERVKSLTY